MSIWCDQLRIFSRFDSTRTFFEEDEAQYKHVMSVIGAQLIQNLLCDSCFFSYIAYHMRETGVALICVTPQTFLPSIRF